MAEKELSDEDKRLVKIAKRMLADPECTGEERELVKRFLTAIGVSRDEIGNVDASARAIAKAMGGPSHPIDEAIAEQHAAFGGRRYR